MYSLSIKTLIINSLIYLINHARPPSPPTFHQPFLEVPGGVGPRRGHRWRAREAERVLVGRHTRLGGQEGRQRRGPRWRVLEVIKG